MPMPQRRYKRRIKLIKPRLQLKLIGAFLALTAISMLLQFVLVGARVSHLARSMPQGGDFLVEKLPGLLVGVLLFSLIVLLPAVLGVGVLVTFRIAGPVYRFEQHLSAVARGEDPGPCRLRRGDELQALCHLINQALDARSSTGARPAATAELETPAESAAAVESVEPPSRAA